MDFIKYKFIVEEFAKENDLPLPIEENISFYVGFFEEFKLNADAISSEENLKDALENYIKIKGN